jgi:hypothetical protein
MSQVDDKKIKPCLLKWTWNNWQTIYTKLILQYFINFGKLNWFYDIN